MPGHAPVTRNLKEGSLWMGHEVNDEAGAGSASFVDEADVIGLYPVDIAAVASRTSLTDLGSGQWRTDD